MDYGALVLSQEPLPASETTVTLDIVDEEEVTRGELLEKKSVEGRITVNPQRFPIFFIPPVEAASSQPQLAVDRAKWDLYLVIMPFTLHGAVGDSYYREVTFLVSLANREATACDLFPKSVTTTMREMKSYTLSPRLKFQEVQPNAGQISRVIRFDSLKPTIRAFGEGESRFYWIYKGFKERKEVTPEIKHALVVLQVARGTTLVEGSIEYEVVLTKRWLDAWKSRTCNVDPYPIRWELASAPTLFNPGTPQRDDIAGSAVAASGPGANTAPSFDVCIACAMADEAEAFMRAAANLYNVTLHQGFSPQSRREYRHTTITNCKGEPLNLLVSWQPAYGPLEAGLHLKPLLEEFEPRFVAMTGICAGDRRKVSLGDIVVAERAFSYDAGKIVIGSGGQPEHLRDTATQHPTPDVLHLARMFQAWRAACAALQRPPSHRQQRDWLLTTLLEQYTPRIDDILQQELQRHAPDWRKIVHELQSGPQPLLTKERAIQDRARIYELRYGVEAFPYKDPLEPALHIAPMASGSMVHADNPFDTIRLPVRDTVAIDMEGAAFYRTVADFAGMRSLVVKGVCDYADDLKDDSYHVYAASVSAIYVLFFIRAYVTSNLMP